MTTSLNCPPSPSNRKTITHQFARKISHLALGRPSMNGCGRVAI